MKNLQNNTQIANRYGLNIRLCDANDVSSVYQVIDFANISSVSLSGDDVYAYGGSKREKCIGFRDKIVGEFTISTQILTSDLLCLMTGKSSNWDGVSPIVFKNRFLERTRYFSIVADTVWKDKYGNLYGERLVFHKVKPRIAFNRKYTGDGDVADVEITFDVMQDENGKVLTRGEPKFLTVGTTLMTTCKNVEDDGRWIVDDFASLKDDGILVLSV